jgi:hypothetical protein
MKKLLSILTFLLISKTLLADEHEKPVSPPLKHHLISVGGSYSHVHIDLKGNPNVNGNLGGMQTMYEYLPPNALYAGAAFNWRQGNTSGASGSLFLTDYDISERLGYTWQKEKWLFTLFSGFGLRILKHHQKYPGGFDFDTVKLDYYQFYFPIGLKSEYAFTSWFSLGTYLTWKGQALSTLQIRPYGGAYWQLSNTFTNFLVELPFIFTLTETRCFSLVIKPFYERWQDGHSTASTSTGIPLGIEKNTYDFFGIYLNLGYLF